MIVFQMMAFSASAQWYQIWADEFNAPAGTGANLTYWTHELGCVCPNFETVCYTNSPTNARHNGNGQFVIEAQSSGGTCGQSYTSARMITQNKFSNLYGRYEASIQLPQAQGSWPAFWLLGENIGTVGWPACGEIDIMETVWFDIDVNHGSAHGPGYSGASPMTGSFSLMPPAILSDTFHVYAVEWDTREIRYNFYGNLFYTFTPADLGGNPWVFDTPMFIILNVAVGGLWPGAPIPAPYPDSMLVDYVRVYKRSSRIEIDGPDQVCPGAEGLVFSVPNDPSMTYFWTVPPGVTIVSGQGTNEITVDWGTGTGAVTLNFTDGASINETPILNVNFATNTLRNPGFEAGFSDWNLNGGGGFSLNTTDFFGGTQSAEAIITTAGGGNPWDVQFAQAEVRLDTGQTYDLHFYARALNNNRRIRVNFINNGADAFPAPPGWFDWAVYTAQNFTLSDTWQQYTFTFNAPLTDPQALFTIDLNFDNDTYRFDDFEFACDASGSLPVTWAYFSAEAVLGHSLLHWQATSDVGQAGYEVQRSADGHVFETLVREAVSLDAQEDAFNFRDFSPLEGLNYYRIGLLDLNGELSFSEILAVDHAPDFRLRVELQEGPGFSVEMNAEYKAV
ncbi:MAG: family 16 glycosylhydrolase, partial [Bacteroidota bacterium]